MHTHSGSFCIFSEIHCEMSKLMVFCKCRPSDSIKMGKEVILMNEIISFILSVAANVVAHCICKWLDEQFKGR